MSITPVAPGARRVRHQAQDAAALMAFSAVVSLSFATALLFVASLGR